MQVSVDAAAEHRLRRTESGRPAGICERLYLSPKTVEAHVTHILTKLDIHASHDDHRRVLAVLTYLRSS